jgi:hypothetical protein
MQEEDEEVIKSRTLNIELRTSKYEVRCTNDDQRTTKSTKDTKNIK